VAGDRAVVGASTTGDRGRANRWGRRGRERAARVQEDGADRPGPRGSEREKERGRTGWCRQAGPACQAPSARGRGAMLSGPTWAELGFLFSKEFLIAYLFIFSRVFNSNSNQVSNSNQIKHVQQFKEYLDST
jgi:hypothetical protein